jgi:MoaA/NifB/PqqE/SkfB family radical SAM enzyme
LTINNENIDNLNEVLARLLETGLENISLSSIGIELKEKFQNIRDKAAEMGFNLIWDLPVPYSRFNPVAMETQSVPQLTEGAVKGWLYIEPDGDVLPAQSINKVLGNMLEDSWESIWDKAKLTIIE